MRRNWLPARDWARALRWPLRLVGGLLLALFAVWLVLFITKGRFLRPWFERIVSARLHRPVRVAGEFNFYFDPIDIAFRADGMSLGNLVAPGSVWARQADLFDSRHFALRVRSIPLVFGRRKIARAELDGARIALQWDSAHFRNNWTFADPGAPPQPFEMPDIERGLITDTHVGYDDPQSQLHFVVDLNPIAAVHSQIATALGFSGTGTVRQRPVRFAGRIDSPQDVVQAGASRVVLHGEGAATVLDLTGEMPGLSNVTRGHYRLAVRGANMADLFDFIGVVVVPTRQYHLVAEMAHDERDWTFTGIRGVFGKSDIGGRLAIGLKGQRVHLDADLRTASLDLLDAAPFIGFDPARLDRMGTRGLVTRESGHPRILPDAPLRSAELRRFDADVRYRVGKIAARDFPVSQIDARLVLDHGKLVLEPVSAIVATGRLDGAFVLDARGRAVVTDYQIHLHPTPMGKLLHRFGVEESGTSGTLSARLALHGVGDSLRASLGHANGRMVAIIPAGTMWARNVQLAELDIGTFITKMFQKKLKEPVVINCGLIGFTVRDGVSSADPILIDTKKNIVTGTGQFSFRDESVNLAMRARGKTFSLFSLQSPVGLGGYMAAPHLKVISPQLLTRVGAGAAVGALVSPIAALVAFIDPGDAHAAACGPVLSGARANAQHTRSNKPIKGL